MIDSRLDREAIAEQMARYAFAFDAHDIEGWASVFTDDGVFEVRVGDAPFVRLTGADELRRFAAASPPVVHHITSLVFDELDSHSARTRAVVLGTWRSPPDGSPEVFTHGTYEARWSKVGAVWRIVHLLFLSLGYSSGVAPPTAVSL